jgi:hypothetical protein
VVNLEAMSGFRKNPLREYQAQGKENKNTQAEINRSVIPEQAGKKNVTLVQQIRCNLMFGLNCFEDLQ